MGAITGGVPVKKIRNILKLIGIFAGVALILWCLLFDLIDWLTPGDFPNWVYTVDLGVAAVILVDALVIFISDYRQRRKTKRKQD